MKKTINPTSLGSFIRHLKPFIQSEQPTVLKENGKDISISTDKILHVRISEFLKNTSEFPILSEEAEDCNRDYRLSPDYYWIIDPLDGTMNFFRSIPLYCVSIALWEKEQPIAGFIYDFNNDELFTGVCEKSFFSDQTGAWLNNTPIRVSQISDKERGVLCLGFPSLRSYEDKSLNNFVRRVREWKKVRLIGSAALSLAWVACGRFEAYIEEGIRIWDVAAGLAIITAAGGECFIQNHNKDNILTVVATNHYIPSSILK